MHQSRPQQDNTRTRIRRRIRAEERKKWGNLEGGFTLVEVMAAIVILSIVSLVLTSYFSNALSYANKNQNKTVMVNLARNALFYVERQDFDEMKEYFRVNAADDYPDISTEQCKISTPDSMLPCSELFSSTELLESVLNPTINGVGYNITISYQSELYEGMLHPTHTQAMDDGEQRKAAMAKYLLPVKVTVRSGAASSVSRSNDTVVEGYITDDKIR